MLLLVARMPLTQKRRLVAIYIHTHAEDQLRRGADATLKPYRSSSGWTHLYGVIPCCSVNLIIRTGGL